jgi:hypothetical protein
MTTEVIVEGPNNVIVQIVESPKIVEVRTPGVQGPIGKGHLFRQEGRYITTQEKNEQRFYLGMQADPNTFMLFNVSGATVQIRDIDWEYDPVYNAISWQGLGLNSLLDETDLVEAIYLPL